MVDPAAWQWPAAARERGYQVGTILIVDDKVPEPDKHAGGLTMSQYVGLLVDQGFKVVFLPDDRIPRQPYTRALQRGGVEVLYGDVDVGAWLCANGADVRWALVARPNIAPRYIELLRDLTRARILYYTHDLHFVREMRRYEATGDREALRESRRIRAIEADIFRTVDQVLSPSADEADVIRRLAPASDVRVIPPYIYPVDPTPALVEVPLERRRDILFVGGFLHTPNVDAACFLAQEILPLVRREVADARLLLVGSSPTPEILALAGPTVTVLGYVPYLDPYFARSRVSVSPLRFGAGVKGKIVASLQAGVPVVTTTIGNEGIGLLSGTEALVDDTAQGLAREVVRVFRDDALARSLAVAGRRLVAERFGEANAREALFEAMLYEPASGAGARAGLQP